MASWTNPIPFSLNSVECVVEAICHLVPHLGNQATEADKPLMSCFERAIEFLKNLSITIGAARRALDVLGGIADKEWLNNSSSEDSLGLDYAQLFSAGTRGLRQNLFDDLLIPEWPEICLPEPDIDIFPHSQLSMF